MTHILHRQIKGEMPTVVGGRGVELYDACGRIYIDASGGAAVSCLGHGHPDVIAALHAQLDKIPYAHTGFFTSEAAEALAERLVANAPEGHSHVYFVSGGSEAVEAALKMARQYFVEKGEPQRRHIVARRQSSQISLASTPPHSPVSPSVSAMADSANFRTSSAALSPMRSGIFTVDKLDGFWRHLARLASQSGPSSSSPASR
jgi:4-aminobutyrate aminotransferase-like enzyme